MQPPRANASGQSRPARALIRAALLAVIAGTALLLWYAFRHAVPPAAGAPAARSVATPRATAVAAAAPAQIPGLEDGAMQGSAPPASVATREVVVGRNDTLDGIFRRLALDLTDLAAIRNLPGIRQSLDFLKPGDAIRLTYAEGAVQALRRAVSETQMLEVVRRDTGFQARMIPTPVETRIRTATATIKSSLFEAAESARISDVIALKLAGVFAWDIDFVLDIREGDRFTAVYEQIYKDGQYVRDGELLAAEFENGGKIYRAVRYVDGAQHAGYYTPAGQPMRKAFLRAPLEFTRVSSVFNPHRLHPILNLIRGHLGTDYAAPIGTPVHAAGDGRVSFLGQRGGYGNALVIEHGSHIATLYGHLSRFARHLKVGTPVQQGEVIAYVGMTGLATGPHLHYEYLVNGVHKDPQTVRLPGAEPLRAGALLDFRNASARWLELLRPPANTATATAAAGNTDPLGLDAGAPGQRADTSPHADAPRVAHF